MRFASLFLGLAALPLAAQQQQQLARDIFKQLIEINTTDSIGDNTRAAEAMAARFRAAGYPESDIHVLGPAPKKGNVVVRLHGTGAAKPILFIGHLDVVEAKRSDWSFDPFEFREEGGYFYGRGAQDMKGDDAILVTTFLRLKAENFRPARDMILALTSDEEGGNYNGIDWLVKNHRDLINAEFCINSDGGGGEIRSGKHVSMQIEAAEKVFLSFRLEVTNPGGHSSLPTKDNAIYHLAGGLARLANFDFPVHLFDVTRGELERMAALDSSQTGADMKAVLINPGDTAAVERLSKVPLYNALLRTTCVATMLSGGHAENALPQTASATVNCRLLPVDNPADVEKTLIAVLDDPKISVTQMAPPKFSRFTPINTQVMAAVTAATGKQWPGLPVMPILMTGASDGVYLSVAGIPAYGVGGIFTDRDDIRAHGRDERILVKSFYDAIDFMYEVATRLGRN
ncbi:MAG TPA: M20/M25/M40 family metallo-hydrolase [Bryobacteraceae bacterium]|nr:M20/M25/M40 family metallo-hydrolase [Bryobacteraceae bacterium]